MSDLMNNGIKGFSIALVGFFILILGCNKGKNIPNVNHIVPEFEVVRSEQQLASLDSLSTDEDIESVRRQHPAFWNIFFRHILPLEGAAASLTNPDDAVRQIVSDERLRAILDTILVEYADFSDLESELYEAFQYHEYYFPGNKAPNVYTLMSDFGYFPFIFEDDNGRDGVGISLEMFMGASFPYEGFVGDQPTFSTYLKRTYNRDHIVKKVMDVIVDDIIGPPPGDRLIDLMIHNGKRIYIIELLLPEHPDSIWLEFTPAQLTWCAENERNLWAHYLNEDLLYSNVFSKINKLVNHSPSAPGLPPQAPGRVANWSGWRIIHELIRRNPKMSVIDLVAMRDGQEIMELARYRPR
jgi:hypothetical protein